MPLWLYCAFIFLLAFGFRLNTVFENGPLHVLRGLEMQSVADSLAKTGRFANPFRYETGPTAHLAPVYPLFLSGLERLFPQDADYETAKQVLSALAASLQYALLPLLAVALGLPRGVGIVGALLAIGMFLLLPVSVRPLETQGSWENAWAALGIVALSILAASTIRHARLAVGRAIAWGVGWGVYLLLIPTMVLVYPIWLGLALVIQSSEGPAGGTPAVQDSPAGKTSPFGIADFGLRIAGGGARERLRFAGIATAFLFLTLAPWTIRNWLVLGSPVWGRDNLGLELHVSNNGCAAATFAEMSASGCHAKTHPNANPDEAAKIRAIGEVRYNRERLSEALGWISAHPARFIGLTLERFMLFWLPEVGPGAASYPIWGVTLAGFAGLVLCYRDNRFAALLLGSLLVVYPLIYYSVQHLLRYRYPVLWVSSFMAAYAVMAAWRQWEPIRRLRR